MFFITNPVLSCEAQDYVIAKQTDNVWAGNSRIIITKLHGKYLTVYVKRSEQTSPSPASSADSTDSNTPRGHRPRGKNETSEADLVEPGNFGN